MTKPAPSGWVLGLLAVALLLIVAAAIQLPVALDEAYYWTWSQQLSWAYYDHPPGVAWLIALSRGLFGEGQLALRAVSMAAMAITGVFTWLAAREAVPHRSVHAGRIAVLLLLGAPMFVVGYLPLTPDPLQGATLAVCAWMVPRTQRVQASWVWGFALALLLTVGVLVKHSTALVAVGALLGALSCASGRRSLRHWGPWVGLLLGAGLVGYWLISDLGAGDGATEFQALRVAGGRPYRGWTALPVTVGALLISIGPGATFALGGGVHGWSKTSGAQRIWLGGASSLVLGCLVAAWLGAGEVNWLMPALIFGSPAALQYAFGLSPRGLKGFTAVTTLTAVLGLVVLVHIVYPFFPLPARKDRTLRAAGYEDVAQVVQQIAREHGATVLVTRSYQSASQFRFHLKDAWPVLETGSKRRSQYDRWPRPSLCPGDVAVLAWNRRDMPAGLQGISLAPLQTIERGRAGRKLDPIFVQVLKVTGIALCMEPQS